MKIAKQAGMGKIVALSAAFVLLLPLLPLQPPATVEQSQSLTLEGVYIRDGAEAFPQFLEGIKRNGGVLVLGTSETGNDFGGRNYWGFLNRDVAVKRRFSVLAGAGRCSYVWFPAMLTNQESFSGLTVLYYLNPTYWRRYLNGFDILYYDRYNSPRLVKQTLGEARRMGLSRFVDPYWIWVSSRSGLRTKLSTAYRRYMSYYQHDLKQWATRESMRESMPERTERFDRPTAQQTAAWQAGVDLKHNAKPAFVATHRGVPDVDQSSDFQYEALKAFASLARKLGIRLVVFIGPYNGVLAQTTSPEVIPHYEELFERVRGILQQSGTPYIDGSDLSYETGTFIDAQHISPYGGWRVEQKIAEHFRIH